jgi:hypothetical protein
MKNYEVDALYTDIDGKETLRTFLALELADPAIDFFFEKSFKPKICRFYFK